VARLTIVGNPDNRRVGLFRAAVRSAGWPEPTVVPWLTLLTAPSTVDIPDDSLVRIDSPGEDAEVDRLLRGAAEPARPGEILGLAAWYRGFADGLARVERLAGRATLVSDPAEILVMFDKRACHARLLAAGIPVPPALPPVGSYAELRVAMAAQKPSWGRVFVKPAHGSSASGVLALRVAGTAVRVTTSVEVSGGRLYNSLRVREYRDEPTIASIVDTLAPDGLHVEHWYPKAALRGRVLDLRVVVIGGRASHVVVRTSRSPMTNLHLGGQRGDLDAVRELAGPSYVDALGTCERVAACFPGSLHVGVDLMFSPDWAHHAVAEVNAFGDLLPGLLVDGRDTYAAQLHALGVVQQGAPTGTHVSVGAPCWGPAWT
jgi:hypothetical protein